MDWTTINLKVLHTLPAYKLPPTYFLQRSPGNCCAGDPPGYPTYFTRSIWTQSGNSPPWNRCPQQVISRAGRLYVTRGPWGKRYDRAGKRWVGSVNLRSWDDQQDCYDRLMRRLWRPLPLEHPRTQAWIAAQLRHFRNCYHDPRFAEHSIGATHIGPFKIEDLIVIARGIGLEVPAVLLHCEQGNAGDVLVSLSGLSKVDIDAYAAFLADIYDRLFKGNRAIRRFYPEFKTEDYTGGPGLLERHSGNWWETEAEQPTPETCKPRYGGGRGGHPVNSSWCQWCGWRKEDDNE